MPAEGLCPACGHLVIEDDGPLAPDTAPVPPKVQSTGLPVFVSSDPKLKPGAQPLDLGHQLARARDYTALLLGVTIYSVLLHPTLAYLMLRTSIRSPDIVMPLAALYVPLSYVITRLMCTIQPETGRWVIKHDGLRRVFTKLNALWFGL